MKSIFTIEKKNPGLEPYDLSNYKGVKNENFFLSDNLLKRIFIKEIILNNYSENHSLSMWKHLEEFGSIAGGILNELAEIAHKEENLGKLVNYDKSGNRIDEIEYSLEQKEIRRICYEAGIVNLDFFPNWKYPFTMFHRMALAYISNKNGEAGVNCPLAMTDGMIRVIKELGTQSQKERYLPLIAHPESKSHFMCGQFVTERVGGSNVGANRTIARKIEEGNGVEPAKWILNGEKWFCSNPGDLWVTTAKIENTNTIGLFLVPKYLPDGTRNQYQLLRKKEIIGSKGKLTVESIYEGTYAESLGKPSHGLVNLIKYVINISRIHVGISACSMSSRAIRETYLYCTTRNAYGRKILDFPQSKLEFLKMILRHATITLANFYNFFLIEKNDILSDLFTPLLKYISTISATMNIKQAILFHGGNGILNDFSCLPRLLNDSIINETWEGAHPVIQDHTIKALKKPKIQKRLEEELNLLKDHQEEIYKIFYQKWNDFKKEWEVFEKSEELLLLNKQYIVETLFYIIGFYLLLKESNFIIQKDTYNLEFLKKIYSNNSTDPISKRNQERMLFLNLAKFYSEFNPFREMSASIRNLDSIQNLEVEKIISYFGKGD
ncbi:MAG: acyl-CoA dehydrogenase family protein [Leptonema sp. (in: bacteria)]